MAPRIKCTEADKKAILERLARKEPIALIAKAFGLSVPYIYKLRQDAETDNLADSGGAESKGAPIRKSIFKLRCTQCDEWFDRFEGEKNKVFCCGEHYVDYNKRTDIPPKGPNPVIFYPVHTLEYQKMIFGSNSIFFPEHHKKRLEELELIG